MSIVEHLPCRCGMGRGLYSNHITILVVIKAIAAQQGNVRIQPPTILLVTPQRTAENLRVAPTPMMAVVMV